MYTKQAKLRRFNRWNNVANDVEKRLKTQIDSTLIYNDVKTTSEPRRRNDVEKGLKTHNIIMIIHYQ